MEHRGIKYDKERAQETLKKVREDMSTLLTKIEAVAGRPVNPNSSAGANSLANILYSIQVDLTPYQVFGRLSAIQPGQTISIDIEGTVTRGITCIGIAESPLHGFVFWPCKMLGDQQTRVFRELGRVLADARIGKILQNSLYDNFALAWKWKMPIRGVVWDTMLSGWELLPEMEKGLGTLASIYTEEPYYKAERKVTDERTHSLYCGKDATVTYEIMQKHSSCMSESQKKHFQFNM